MIIFNRASGRPVANRTVLPFARDANRTTGQQLPIDDGPSATTGVAPGGRDPELAAETVMLKALGAKELAKLEADPVPVSAGIPQALDTALRRRVEPFLASRPDAASAANAARRFAPILADFSARAAAMEESAKTLAPILQAGESVIAALKQGVDDADDLVRGQIGLVEKAQLSPAQRRHLKTATVARLEREGLGHFLGAEFDADKTEAARLFPAEPETRRPGDGRPPLILASADALPAPSDPALEDSHARLQNSIVAQIDVPPLSSPTPLPDKEPPAAPDKEPRVTQDPTADGPDMEPANEAVAKLSGLIRGTLSPKPNTVLGELMEEAQSGRARHSGLVIMLRQFFQHTLDLNEEQVRNLARQADLDEDIAALFHNALHVTQDNHAVIRSRLRKITDPSIRGPLDNILRRIVNSAPQNRRAAITRGVEHIARYFVLALPLSDKERKRAGRDLLDTWFLLDFDELQVD